jgi:NhaP-type Na+/H+ or K+/H+ antiporter
VDATIYDIGAAVTNTTSPGGGEIFLTSQYAIAIFLAKTWRQLVVLGGIRGAISGALVASLPESNLKDTIATITFGVVLSSLIIQYIIIPCWTCKVC